MMKKVSFVIVPMLAVVALLVYFINSLDGGVVSADFTATRQKAASISENIVNLTTDTTKKIEAANKIQNAGNTDQLLALINEAKALNSTAYQKAFDLSNALQQMAESLNNVGSSRQQIGYEAVALELSLVSEFISYTGSLNDFLDILTKSVITGNPANPKAISDALGTVNQKANFINSLNANFLEKMAAFDQVK